MQTKRIAVLLAAATFVASSGAGRAADLLGLYVGGAVGQARLEAAETVPPPADRTDRLLIQQRVQR